MTQGPLLPRNTFPYAILILIWVIALPGHAWGAKPIPIPEGDYRLGDSPQTPEQGLAWLTIDTNSSAWEPFITQQGHPVSEFTNVWRRFRLPETVVADPTVYLKGWPAFEAYVNGQLIYRAGELFAEPKNKFSSHTWHLLPLPSDYPGRYIYFRTFSEHPDAFTSHAVVSVASPSDHLVNMVRQELAQATVGLFLILIGLASTFVYFRRNFRPALSLGLFAISVGLFTTMHTDIASMLIPPGHLAWYFTHLPLYIFPIPLWMFLDDITDHECAILARLWQIQALFSLGALIIDVLDYYPLVMTTAYAVLLFASILIAIAVTYRQLHKQSQEPDSDATEATLVGWGFGILMFTGTHDILAGLGLIPFVIPIFHYGVLVFSTLLAIILERRFSQAHDQLRAYSRNLERRVEERTQDLGDKNEALERAMTELEETQHQMILREKMASLGDLVAGVAHEVNTPIGAINSSADVADRCAERLSDIIETAPGSETFKNEKAYRQAFQLLRENTGLIKEAGERISRIVRSLRSFARLDEAEFHAVNIHEGIDSTIDLVNHQLKGKIEVIKNYGDVPEVDCYPNQLNQVFMNLLVNASQAIDDTGTITVATQAEGSDVSISIQDTGRGISKEDLDRIFSPGFTTKGVGVGTGLGLSISYKIIEDHSGHIEVETVPGLGAKFRVVIPAHQPDAKPAKS